MASNYFNNNRMMNGFSIPTEGSFNKGDIIVNIGENAAEEPMWICVEAGSPGNWEILGNSSDIKLDVDDTLNRTYSTTKGVCEFESDGNERIEITSDIEGLTFKNMFPKISKSTEDWYMDNIDLITTNANGYVTMTSSPSGYYVDYTAKNLLDFKPNTNYTLFLEVFSNTLADTSQTTVLRIGGNTTNGVFTSNFYLNPNATGFFKKLMTTRADISNAIYAVETVLMATTTGSITFRFMLIEGDHTDKEMRYFQGLKSVGEGGKIEILNVADEVDLSGITWTTGKYINALTGAVVTSSRFSYSNEYIEIDDTRKYLSKHFNRHVSFYNANKTLIPVDPGNDKNLIQLHGYNDYLGGYLELLPPKGSKYIRITVENNYKNDIELYGSYNKVTVPGNLRSLPNGKRDSIEKHGDKYYHMKYCESYTTGTFEDLKVNKTQSNSTTFLAYIALALDDGINTGADDYNTYADIFPVTTIWANTVLTEGAYKSTGRNLYFRILKSRLTSPDMIYLKTWLVANPITMVYEIARPVITEIPKIELLTFKGTNKLIMNTDMFVKEVDFKVVKSLGNNLDNMDNKINSIDDLYDQLNKNTMELNKLYNRVTDMQDIRLTTTYGYIDVDNGANFDYLTNTGWYYLTNPVNGPVSGGAWYIEVISRSAGHVYQRAIRNINTDAVALPKYERECYGYVWSSWRNIYEKIPSDAVTVPQWYANSWVQGTTISSAREQLAGAIVDNFIYCMGGYSGSGSAGTTINHCYNAVTNSWTTKTAIPAATFYSTASAVGTNIYLMGGSTSTSSGTQVNTNRCYDTVANSWTTKTVIPMARSQATSCTVYDLIYLLGGTGGTGNHKNVYCYSPSTNTWTAKANATVEIHFTTSAVVNRKIYTFGSATSSNAKYTRCYDPYTDTWTNKTDMTTGRRGAGAVAIGTDIYVIAGFDSINNPTNDQALTVVECYDTTTDNWSAKTDIPVATQNFVAEAYNGVIYTMGGYTRSGTMNSYVRAYIPN